ncbi:MAG: hypothetical protein ACLUTU_20155 [Blautia faecis]
MPVQMPRRSQTFIWNMVSKTVIVKLGETGAYYKTKDGAQGTVLV